MTITPHLVNFKFQLTEIIPSMELKVHNLKDKLAYLSARINQLHRSLELCLKSHLNEVF